MGLFDGKVVAITGAGAGLGRAYAHAFGKEGAMVVVNDLGGARDGTGASAMVADTVVNELKEMGVKAVANYDTVATMEGAKNIVKSAVDAFGKLDVMVNNAGILRDKSFMKMDEEMWDIVIEVHLKGTFACCQAAAAQMLEQDGGGRIINTSSYAGLKGNFGQTNYAAAKAGIAGITRVLALELARKGITVNCIAPLAKTRLTDDIAMVPDDAKPEFVAPIVVYLASDLAKDINGRIFGVHANHLFEYKMEMTPGVDKGAEIWTPQEIHERLDDITKSAHELAKKDEGGAADLSTICFNVLKAQAKAFDPGKAGDWKAVLHFNIESAGKYTMTIGDGKIAVDEGHKGENTCVVEMSSDTFLGMVKGEIEGPVAFMQGKIKATNMKDMIKYGTAFDKNKAEAEAKKALAAAEPSGEKRSTTDIIQEVMQSAAQFLVPDKAGDWKAILHFIIDGGGEHTMKIADGKCTVSKGKEGDPTCVVEMSADTFLGMVKGEIEGPVAFMQGKIKATNMKDMMKYGSAFDQKKSREAAIKIIEGDKEEAAPEKAKKPKPRGLNRDLLGKIYRSAPILVKPTMTMAYAKATNDENPYYVDESRGEGLIAPVIFPVRLLKGVLGNVLFDPDLNANLVMLVHGEQDMLFHEPIHAWDLVYPQAQIVEIEDKETGQTCLVHCKCLKDNKLVTEAYVNFFIRDPEKKRGKKEPKEAPKYPEFTFEDVMQVRKDQTYDYAEASGDHNPIHVDEAAAKQAGFETVIVHGLCTMAFTSQAVVKHLADGDPTRVRRLKVRFSKIVYPKDTLTTQGYIVEENEDLIIAGYHTVNQKGEEVITNGVAEVRKS